MDVIKVFFSSPGDVADERSLARNVLKELQEEPQFRDRLMLREISWDNPYSPVPMDAHLTPQEAINQNRPKPSECDIVIVILWSRMGTFLPEYKDRPQELRYWSGTAWECFDALDAADAKVRSERNHAPRVFIYRRSEEPIFKGKDPQRQEKLAQFDRVEEFFKSFRNPDGSLRRSVTDYDTSTNFAKYLEDHLREVIWPRFQAAGVTQLVASKPTEGEEAPWKNSPYPGLRVFTGEEAAIFYGRGRETDDLVRLFAERTFVAVTGASGSGKSSLVAAGLLPRIHGGAVPQGQQWVSVRFTPAEVGDNPFVALATGFKERLTAMKHYDPEVQANAIEVDHGVLSEMVKAALHGKHELAEVILFVDQFEELFTIVDKKYQTAFVELIVRASKIPRLRTIITMRADLAHHCLAWPELVDLLNAGEYKLSSPGVGALHDMIVRPAARAELTFESKNLVQQILDQTGTAPGALPLMAFALSELWDAKTEDRRLTQEAYDRFGGVPGAIGKRAEETFDKLAGEPSSKEAALADVFRELVDDKEGVPVRRRARRRDVSRSPTAAALVDALEKARLLLPSRAEDNEDMIEVAHEAILTNWPRLDDWIKTSRDDLRARRQMTQAAEEWDKQGRKEKFLWSDERVVDMAATLERLGLTVKDLSVNERDFLGPLDRGSMLKELDDANTTHERRAIIGVRLSLLPLGDTRPGVGLRFDGLPEIVWCEVPKGEVTLEKDAGTFPVEPFQISKYPITWVQYRAFLEAPDGFRESAWWEGLEFQVDKPGKQFNRYDNHPAENVCWLEAVAFCNWLTRKYRAAGLLQHDKVIRLPTEWEWQQAATGGDPNREYPWGEWQSELANTYDSELGRSTAVGMYPRGSAPEPIGALDMSGNVWEWCLNKHEKKSVKDVSLGGLDPRVVRGGSWDLIRDFARAAFRLRDVPNFRFTNVGFRVVSSSPIS